MPAASAAMINVIRTAIIPRLPEPGQRQLLSALARAASHAIAPPVIVAALEGCGVLLELLGGCLGMPCVPCCMPLDPAALIWRAALWCAVPRASCLGCAVPCCAAAALHR
jgi:hypothetical protein